MNNQPAQGKRRSIASKRGKAAQALQAAANMQRLGEDAMALELYDEILSDAPAHEEALQMSAIVLMRQGRLTQALSRFDQALALQPRDAALHNNRGNVLYLLGRPEPALHSFERALQLDASHGTFHMNRGNALLACGRADEALASFDRALALMPDAIDVQINRSTALLNLGREAEALEQLDRALQGAPASHIAHANRGHVLLRLKRYEEALQSMEAALACQPHYGEAHNGRGTALFSLGRLQEALHSFTRALELNPDLAQAYCNRANALVRLGRSQQALENYVQAIARNAQYALGHFYASMCRLLLGDFESGWPEYEWRWRTDLPLFARPRFATPPWLGQEDVRGKVVLLHAEQGLGDTLQFCRYARRVADRGATVLLRVPESLKTLLADLQGVARVLSEDEAVPRFDYHCPLMSLPLALRERLETVDGAPYLQVSGETRSALRLADRTAQRRGRIGVVWSGNPDHGDDANRSIPLARFQRLLDAPADYYCLQKTLRSQDEAIAQAWPELRRLGDVLTDFADTARVIAQLDLVITVDTAVAHLAGAMGKPVWILLPFSPDWRWLLNRDDSPWYHSARLFRQTAAGDWDSVLERVKTGLMQAFA